MDTIHKIVFGFKINLWLFPLCLSRIAAPCLCTQSVYLYFFCHRGLVAYKSFKLIITTVKLFKNYFTILMYEKNLNVLMSN